VGGRTGTGAGRQALGQHCQTGGRDKPFRQHRVMEVFTFGSESVTEGHPDKLCDRVSDAVLDACLAQDPEARVACEACTKSGMVMILGEVITKASVNYEQVIREAIKATCYDSDDKGLDWRTVNVIVAVEEQSPDLAHAITASRVLDDTAGDQGIVFGYATDETGERHMMPLSHVLATRLCIQLDKARKDGTLSWARPDGRAQVVVEYNQAVDGSYSPARVKSVVVSTRHAADIKPEVVEKELMEHVVKVVVPESLCDASTTYHLAQPKPMSLSGGNSDAGMSGRKNMADTYGGWGSHGGGSLSGKDGSKVHRSATYGARWAARSLVDARLCRRCLVQLSYSPASPQPVSLHVNSFGTAKAFGKSDAELLNILQRNFDFRPACLQRDLGLKAPQFQNYSAYGHLGRLDLDPLPPWEKSKDLK